MALELIDLENLKNNDKNELTRMKKAMAEIGFLKIKNHGLSRMAREQFEEKIKEFFALDLEAKNESASKLSPMTLRGYYGRA